VIPNQASDVEIICQFDDNALLQMVLGSLNTNLDHLEKKLGVSLNQIGNAVTISGAKDKAKRAEDALNTLYERVTRGLDVTKADVDATVRMSKKGGRSKAPSDAAIHTRKRTIEARSPGQVDYIRAMQTAELVFGIGPAGTGKTYMAVAKAVEAKIHGQVERIILSRPAVEAGERLGFLPGDMKDKIDPYLRPLYDALHDTLPGAEVVKCIENGEIEVAPLAFMRGRTLSNAFVILDEAQNTTPTQMKMFLTRLGENSRMIITGDMSQVDLPFGAKSGLQDAVETLENRIKEVRFIHLTSEDVVRHDLVTKIVRAYEQSDNKLKVVGK
jgi:phosphate starvation-inducible PhoH-like protein